MLRELFQKFWRLSYEVERTKKSLEEKQKRLGSLEEELLKVRTEIVKEGMFNYVVPLDVLYKHYPEIAEQFIKEKKVVHKLKLCEKKFKWQKSVIEVLACHKPEGLLLCNDPTRCEKCVGKKIKIIQV